MSPFRASRVVGERAERQLNGQQPTVRRLAHRSAGADEPQTHRRRSGDTPPDKAIDWQPSEQDQADFAAFTCADTDKEPDIADQPLFSCDEDEDSEVPARPHPDRGHQLSTAVAGVPQNDVRWVVNLSFNSDGAVAFENATRTLAARTDPQNRFAIVLDGVTISAPSVSAAIPGGRAEISGNFNQKSATQLANVLKYGALPLSFEVSEVSNVSATLGKDQLRAGIIAGIVGLALVVVYCFLYYRGLGIVVVTSLAVAAVITYEAMVLLGGSVGFALNLAGIAGAIVAIGITADSFVIYFERIRDEVREGRSLRTAVETGWRRARQTILIADAVSLLSALILFILAIGSVKGFAFTLGLTTLIDVLVVFMFTKPLLSLLARTKFFGGGHRLSGLDPAHLGVRSLPGSRTSAGGSVRPAEGRSRPDVRLSRAGSPALHRRGVLRLPRSSAALVSPVGRLLMPSRCSRSLLRGLTWGIEFKGGADFKAPTTVTVDERGGDASRTGVLRGTRAGRSDHQHHRRHPDPGADPDSRSHR